MRLLKIKLQRILRMPLLFALFGFFSCVILSVVYNFEDATKTHCNVPNYIPSISTSIGDFRPQTYIWRICIALHCFPRIMISIFYFNYYALKLKDPPSTQFTILNGLNSLLTILEILALLVLTYVSSRENFGIHENAFISFMVCSMCYMLTTCILFKWTSKDPMTNEEVKSFKRKIYLMITNYSSFALAVYFYFRHNWYCEPGIYSYFALCEYVTVLTNIWFHSTAIIDLGGLHITIGHEHSS
ncbi:post-GPI attachment to proteins factor 2-like isoform X2 [Dendronephthya gigantea]|uniref:post-GPI attachment to proteins factor 2-like isoform X2 n=1 Tax=Dendronephthya gigantea TaxID=151771 RepID=UPI00106BC714|nr:post-GPI attachment to proteins factor 2-like isoform X2 [Dendronephthya gigantea]